MRTYKPTLTVNAQRNGKKNFFDWQQSCRNGSKHAMAPFVTNKSSHRIGFFTFFSENENKQPRIFTITFFGWKNSKFFQVFHSKFVPLECLSNRIFEISQHYNTYATNDNIQTHKSIYKHRISHFIEICCIFSLCKRRKANKDNSSFAAVE